MSRVKDYYGQLGHKKLNLMHNITIKNPLKQFIARKKDLDDRLNKTTNHEITVEFVIEKTTEITPEKRGYYEPKKYSKKEDSKSFFQEGSYTGQHIPVKRKSTSKHKKKKIGPLKSMKLKSRIKQSQEARRSYSRARNSFKGREKYNRYQDYIKKYANYKNNFREKSYTYENSYTENQRASKNKGFISFAKYRKLKPLSLKKAYIEQLSFKVKKSRSKDRHRKSTSVTQKTLKRDRRTLKTEKSRGKASKRFFKLREKLVKMAEKNRKLKSKDRKLKRINKSHNFSSIIKKRGTNTSQVPDLSDANNPLYVTKLEITKSTNVNTSMKNFRKNQKSINKSKKSSVSINSKISKKSKKNSRKKAKQVKMFEPSEPSEKASNLFRGLQSSSQLINHSSMDRGLMFSQLNLDDGIDYNIGKEFKINQTLSEIPFDATFEEIQEKWDDIIFVLMQDFMTLSYLNSFSKVLNILKMISEHIWKLVGTVDFKLIFGEEYPYKYRQNSDNIQKVLNPTRNELISNNLSIKNRIQGETGETKQLILSRVERIDHEHLYFFRKILVFYFKSLDHFLGSMMLDYEKLVAEFLEYVKIIREFYKDIEILVLYALSNYIEKAVSRTSGIDPELFTRIINLYFLLLDDILYQNIEYYRADSNRYIQIDYKKLRLSRTMSLIFKNAYINFKFFKDDELMGNISDFLQSIKEYVVHSQMFIGSEGDTKGLIVELFACSFLFLKHNFLYDHFSSISPNLGLNPNQFFQTVFLEFLKSFQDFKSYESAISLESAMSVFLSIRNHIERSEEFSMGNGFRFDPYIIQQCAIFLQKFVKLGCLKGKFNDRILKMCILLVDCFIHIITLKLINLRLQGSTLNYELIRMHFKNFISMVQKCKRISENVAIKKELVSKLGLVVKLIDLREVEE